MVNVLIPYFVFFCMGALTATVTFMLLREWLIDRALDRRESEIYGPLLERVEAQQARARERRNAAPRAGASVDISLASFPINLDRFPAPTVQQRRH